MARVFISHSSRDDAAARWIADWLHAQRFEAPFLDFDKHSGIPPGADWERTLYREIATSQALLIVQSRHWDASKWCFAEFAQARALGKPIFQLVGVPGIDDDNAERAQAPICSDLQQLNLKHDLEAALESLSRELIALSLSDRGGFPWDPLRPPYPGLLNFDQEDAAIFFGRDQEIRHLIEQLQVLRIHGSDRLVVVLGASGSGKSSLLRAGVLARLARSGRHWLLLQPFRPQRKPTEALAQAISLAVSDDSDWRQQHHRLCEAEATDSLAPLLSTLASDLRMTHRRAEAQILISVDQAEELFAEADQEDGRRFFRMLSAALESGVGYQVVMTLRSDFLGSLQAAAGLSVPLHEISLPPLAKERIVDIITGPAQVAGIRVEDAFVQAAIHDADTDDALPLLAFALREIYDLGGADRVLNLADYQALGDPEAQLSPLENSVRRAADGVLSICKPSQEEKLALRDAFVPAMVRVNEQDNYTRRPARWLDLPPAAWPLLNHLVQARLLTVEQRGEERWIEVAHEALLRKWPLLREWLDDAREFLIGTQHLERELRDWQEAPSEQKSSSLLSGLKLTRAQTWVQERPQQIPGELRAFIDESMAHRDQLLKKQRRRQQLVLAGLTLLSLGAGSAWGWGELRNRAALESQTRQFQSVHLSMLELDPMLSVVNGLAAMARLRDNLNEALPLAISINRATQLNSFRGRLLSGHDEVWSLAETPSGRLISGGRDGNLRIWTAKGTLESEPIPTGHRAGIRGIVAINEQDWWTAGDDGTLQHWVGRARKGAPITTGHGSIQNLVLTRDGNLLSVGTDGLLRRWKASTGQSLGPPLASAHLEVWTVAVLPNGDWVTGGREGLLQWWRDGKPNGAPVASGQGAVSALAALPDNGILSGGDDGSMRIWSKNGVLTRMMRSGHSSIFTLLRRHHGKLLSGGSERLASGPNNFIRIWELHDMKSESLITANKKESLSIVELCNGDLISGGSGGFLHHWRGSLRLGSPIKTPHHRVYALTVLPSGDVVSGGDDGSFLIWRNGHPVSQTFSLQGGVTSLHALPDGSLLTGGRDGSIKHWLSQGGYRVDRIIHTKHGAVWAVVPLANGDLLSGGDDGFIRRWRNGQQVGVIKTPHTTVVSLVVRRNGDWISGGSGGDIQLWRGGRPLGDYFQVASGSVWSLAELRNGELVSANGDGTLTHYPSPGQAIANACQQWQHSSLSNHPGEPAEQVARNLCKKVQNQRSTGSRPRREKS